MNATENPANNPALGDRSNPLTMCEAFQATVAALGDAVALRNADGSVTYSFDEYGAEVAAIAAGLAGLGLARGDALGLMLVNRPEFHLLDTAAIHLGATPFSIYNTSASVQIVHVLENSGASIVVTEAALLPSVLGARELLDRELTVVSVDGHADTTDVLGLDELKAAAAADFDFEAAWTAVEPSDALTLIYTSGTTGPPKGVETSHANMLAQCRSVAEVLPISRGARITSYLPSAHIADRWSSHYNQMLFGVEITSVADPSAVAEVLPRVRPTIWGAVPRVLEKIAAGIETAVAAEQDPAKRQAIEAAIALGVKRVQLEQQGKALSEPEAARHSAFDAKVLAPLRAKIGLDQAEWIIVGAAPMPRKVQEFLMGLGLPIAELYGMSECSCAITCSPPAAAKIGSVGPAIPGVEVKLAEDGELCVRGPIVMKGYRNQPEKTAEVIDSEGWLHTGDIAEIDPDGYVRIVDRKKELIINAAGKNMSPANIEQELKVSSPLIGQAVCIGDARPYNVALLVLDPDVAAARIAAEGRDRSAAELAGDPAIIAEVGAGVEAANANLSRVEQIKKFALLADEWLPGGDELTPTMKLKRKPISRKYGARIEALYSPA